MPLRMLFLCCLLAVSAAGCLMSEQIGEPVGHGNSRIPGKDVAFHFDTDFNRILMVARSGALVGVALWIFSSWGKKPLSVLIGGSLIAAAGWYAVEDYPSLKNYRLEVAEEGLTLRVPPDLDTLVSWRSIEELELEGFGYARIGGSTTPTPFQARTTVNLELPDWRTMKLTLTGGETHTIVLEELSIEHRQIFAKALIKRADLVEID